MLRSVINASKLIEEIKKRPLLYDGGQNTWAHNKKRNVAWEEIAKEIFNEIWEPSDQLKKEALIRELQTKWKSIRDAYQRFCKQSKEDRLTGKQRKPYIYSELLAFLDKADDSPNTNTVYLEENADDDNNEDDNSMNYLEDSNPLQSVGDETNDNEAAVAVAATSTTVTSPTIRTTTEETTSLLARNVEKIGLCLQQLMAMQKEDRKDDKMGNKKFLLSLLPFMERLPDDVNLEVRLQLMSVVQTYTNGDSFTKM